MSSVPPEPRVDPGGRRTFRVCRHAAARTEGRWTARGLVAVTRAMPVLRGVRRSVSPPRRQGCGAPVGAGPRPNNRMRAVW